MNAYDEVNIELDNVAGSIDQNNANAIIHNI